jgi:hypothetical protein
VLVVGDVPVNTGEATISLPLAVNDLTLPTQIEGVAGETTGTGGVGFTDTVTVAVLLQPAAEVPTTVYVVVDAGFAVTVDPVVALSPLAGDHA